MKGVYQFIIVLVWIAGAGVQAQTIPPTPDIFASATAQIRGATQTAQALRISPTVAPTQDPFVLTATELVRRATGTAERQRGATAIPITATEDQFVVTAEALIANATATVQAQNGSSSQAPADQADPLTGALLIFGVVVLVLAGIGAFMFQRSHIRHKN